MHQLAGYIIISASVNTGKKLTRSSEGPEFITQSISESPCAYKASFQVWGFDLAFFFLAESEWSPHVGLCLYVSLSKGF